MNYYHLGELVHKQAAQYKGRTAIKYPAQTNDDKWTAMSWTVLSDKVMKTARAMAEMGICPNENVGIYSQNVEKYLFADFGAYANRAVMVPMYATASPNQIKYIINNAQIRTVFVGEQFQYNNAMKVLNETPTLQKLIIFDRKVVRRSDDNISIYFDDFITTGENSESEALVNARMKQLKITDPATIIYTSGTTGEPKGVVMTHENYIQAFRIHDIRVTRVSDKDISMCFLPLTHIFEKAWTYFCLHRGVMVAINRDPKLIQESLKKIRPTVMSNVPRFWEKVYDGVRAQIDGATGIKKWLFNDAVKTGRKFHLEYRNKGLKAPFGTALKFFMYRRTIFFLVKYVVGIDRGNFFPVAGAPLSDTINELLQSIDVRIIYGYGLTETTATVSCFPMRHFVLGSVGAVMPEVDVKIGENDEILVKGKTVMLGYYNNPEATAEVFTADGYLRTGDAGYLEERDGYTHIVLTDRIKDLYKTSNGKYIAPQMIETRIAEDKYIDQVALIGNERKFVSALIVPNFGALKAYADSQQIEYADMADLVANTQIHSFIEGRIELLQAQFTSYEKIKRFAMLPQAFTVESGELTNTLKIKRKVVLDHYSEVIEQIYKD